MAERQLRCYATCDEQGWEAICVDLNVAVQGRSLTEVRGMLSRAIALYIEEAKKEDPKTRERLLCRRAPLGIRTRYELGRAANFVLSRFGRKDSQARFDIPCRV